MCDLATRCKQLDYFETKYLFFYHKKDWTLCLSISVYTAKNPPHLCTRQILTFAGWLRGRTAVLQALAGTAFTLLWKALTALTWATLTYTLAAL